MTLTSARKRGFTLIEIVVVIIVLGVLAVIALPKFVNFHADSKVAVLEGIAGAMKSGLDIVHSKAVIEGENVALNMQESLFRFTMATLQSMVTIASMSLIVRFALGLISIQYH